MVLGGHGARQEPQAPGESQVLLNHGRDVKTGGSEEVRADRPAATARSSYQSARRPRTKRSHRSCTAGRSRKRHRDVGDWGTLAQSEVAQSAGTEAA